MISVPSTVPPHFSTTMPLFQSVPPHFTVTIPLFHHILLTVTLCYCFTVPPYLTVTWHCHTFPLLYHTLLSPWLRAIVPPYHCDTSATFPPNFTITVTLFHHTLLLLWDRLCHCSTVVPLFTVTATLCHSVPPHFSITIPLFHHILLSLWLCATWQGIVIGLSPILGRPLLIFHCPDALACAADVI